MIIERYYAIKKSDIKQCQNKNCCLSATKKIYLNDFNIIYLCSLCSRKLQKIVPIDKKRTEQKTLI